MSDCADKDPSKCSLGAGGRQAAKIYLLLGSAKFALAKWTKQMFG